MGFGPEEGRKRHFSYRDEGPKSTGLNLLVVGLLTAVWPELGIWLPQGNNNKDIWLGGGEMAENR